MSDREKFQVLASLAGLPHVGGIATRLETDLVTRTIAEISGVVTARERLFAEHGIATMAAYRPKSAQFEDGALSVHFERGGDGRAD